MCRLQADTAHDSAASQKDKLVAWLAGQNSGDGDAGRQSVQSVQQSVQSAHSAEAPAMPQTSWVAWQAQLDSAAPKTLTETLPAPPDDETLHPFSRLLLDRPPTMYITSPGGLESGPPGVGPASVSLHS